MLLACLSAQFLNSDYSVTVLLILRSSILDTLVVALLVKKFCTFMECVHYDVYSVNDSLHKRSPCTAVCLSLRYFDPLPRGHFQAVVIKNREKKYMNAQCQIL